MDFNQVNFDLPEKVRFRQINFTTTSFLETDLRHVDFLDCKWPEGKGRPGSLVLYDEQNHCRGDGLKEQSKPNLRLTQSLYQQLKRNFEENRDYATAGAFHYGEMEMRRLAKPKLWQWVGVLNLYRLSCGYGENYKRAFFAFFILILLFAFIFTNSLIPEMVGTKGPNGAFILSKPGIIFEKPAAEWDWKQIANVLLFSFRTASLLRALPATPGEELYPGPGWGQWLTALLSVFGPVQLALFFLALRRSVRR